MKYLSRIYNLIKDVNGLVTLMDLIGWLGFWLYRGTWRRTMTVGVAMLTVFLVDRKVTGSENLTFSTAVLGTFLFFAASCAGGWVLMFVSSLLSRRHLMLGEVKGANLIERMKQARREVHREHLWWHVFVHEEVITPQYALKTERTLIHLHQHLFHQYGDPARHFEMKLEERLMVKELYRHIGHSREGYDLEFALATDVPISQPMMRDLMRYDLTPLIDWYDGAPFHKTDAKLRQHFEGDEELRHIRKVIPNLFFSELKWRSMRTWQDWWFRIIMRAAQIRVANACDALDKKYAPYTFHADHFFWPSDELNELMLNHVGQAGVEEFNQRRIKLFRLVFRADEMMARKLLLRAVYPNFRIATDLRCKYDPEYILGQMHPSWTEDSNAYARALDKGITEMYRQRRYLRKQREAFESYEKWYTTYAPTDDDGQALALNVQRALRIMFLINRHDFRKMIIKQKAERPTTRADRPRDIQGCINYAINRVEIYDHHLVAVRLHHELTRLEFLDYCDYVDRLIR